MNAGKYPCQCPVFIRDIHFMSSKTHITTSESIFSGGMKATRYITSDTCPPCSTFFTVQLHCRAFTRWLDVHLMILHQLMVITVDIKSTN